MLTASVECINKASYTIVNLKTFVYDVVFVCPTLADPHGLEPHVNVETFTPRNSYPGDKRMNETSNDHVFPKR